MKENYQQRAHFREQASFLGYEFLSWLFLLLDRESAQEELADVVKGITKGHCSIVLGQKLVTCLLHHKEQKTSVTSPILEESHEVFASLKNGHVIEALALSFLIDETKVTLTLHAHDFALAQTKIAADFDADSAGDENSREDDKRHEEILLRMASLTDVETMIDRLYQTFLKMRLERSAYSDALRRMRGQVEERLNNYLRKGRNDAVANVLTMAP